MAVRNARARAAARWTNLHDARAVRRSRVQDLVLPMGLLQDDVRGRAARMNKITDEMLEEATKLLANAMLTCDGMEHAFSKKCGEGKWKEAEQYREAVHTLVDAKLDINMQIARMIREKMLGGS